MKALILSAGLGTRLLPHTKYIPKPLFKVSDKPVIQIMIEKLIASGCDEIYINTHHLHEQIEHFVGHSNFPVPVKTVFEPVILDTGGAIANLRQELSAGSFFVVNGDVITDMDFKILRHFHDSGKQIATLALHNCPRFNKIDVDADGYISSFTSRPGSYAFTGIQILSAEIFRHMPATKIFSSIDMYSTLLDSKSVKACIFDTVSWSDIGTPQSFTRACIEHISTQVLTHPGEKSIDIQQIAGDGSDRSWYRIKNHIRSYVVSDHGIRIKDSNDTDAYSSFIKIGNHLHSRNIPVPRIMAQDRFPGLVVLEDLGDIHLETLIKRLSGSSDIVLWYQKVCDVLYQFSQTGVRDFNPGWTYQTKEYDKPMIIEKECRYFFNEFVLKYLNLNVSYDDYAPEFELIAEKALENGVTGLMHRDFQSRNIMIKNRQIYLIDFQSARIGPVQYDLASLLIDPYVGLTAAVQKKISAYFYDRYISQNQFNGKTVGTRQFDESVRFCSITRNLQILGAFSFLTQVKHKSFFERYIPAAVISLKKHLRSADVRQIPNLYKLVQTIQGIRNWQIS